jgi:GNAT superfamily N-acetyltransferase
VKTHPYSDLTLSRRLERCEAEANAALVEARASLNPSSGAVWMECNGTYALFDGVASPLTQTFGLGLFSVPSESDFELIEQFFADHGATIAHEVSPLAAPETLALLTGRGYRPIEFTSILYRPIEGIDAGPGVVQTRMTQPGEEDRWAATAAEGWSEAPELREFITDLGRVTAASRGTYSFFAELDGAAIGTGAMTIHEGIALLAGASTIPARRRLGAQRALLQTRLAFAAEQGCDLAMMGALPGSASQRNAERQGFRIAYTRLKWTRG